MVLVQFKTLTGNTHTLLVLFVATASIDGNHFVTAWVSEYVTPQQEA